MYQGLHVKYLLFESDFNKTSTFSTDFWKCSNVKFHETPSSGSKAVPCGWTDRHDEATKSLFTILWMHLKNCQQNTDVNITVFCDVTPCSLIDITNVYNEGAATIITSILKKEALNSSEMLVPI
jgi:hypothetical protein